jgi:hypothetical protein
MDRERNHLNDVGSAQQHKMAAAEGVGTPPAAQSVAPEELRDGLSELTEDMALALLRRGDLSVEVIEALSKNPLLAKARKIRFAVVAHPKTPRHISLPMLRHLFTFELMNIALLPGVAGDVKKAAEDALIFRMETISLGEKISLARRASGAVAGALLREQDSQVIRAALNNSQLTESYVVRALVPGTAPAGLAEAVSHHEKWSLRREVQLALLRNPHTPLAKALAFAQALPPGVAREALEASELPESTKECLLRVAGG